MKKYVVNENTTLKAFTDNVCIPASFYLSALLREREIKVNGVKVGTDLPLKKGDEVCYFLSAKRQARTGFSLLYEDENIAVVDKESGVNSEAVFATLSERGEYYFIHRLDRNTCGLLLFARNAVAEAELLSAFKNRRVHKEYEALVVGKMPKTHAVESAFLQKDERTATVKVSNAHGERIVTEYEVVEEGEQTSLVKVTLHTGKTHQIRAHLAYLGNPVVGDEKYGDSAFNKKMHATRQRLVAKRLTLSCEGTLAYLNDHSFCSNFSVKEG